MNSATVLQLMLIGASNADQLRAMIARANAEGRDPTDAEIYAIRGEALAANDQLQADIDATK